MTTPKIRGTRKLLEVKKIQPNPWNPNKLTPFMETKLRKSIEHYGFTQELIVREVAPNQFEIIDGQHRHQAAKEIGMAKVPCLNLGTISDAEAKQLCEIFIHLHGEPDLTLEAKLIRSLVEEGVDLPILEETLPFTLDQLTSLHDCIDFDWNQYGSAPDTTPPAAPAKEDGEAEEPAPVTLTQEIPAGPVTLNDGRLAYTVLGLTQLQLDQIMETVAQVRAAEQCDEREALVLICSFYRTNAALVVEP